MMNIFFYMMVEPTYLAVLVALLIVLVSSIFLFKKFFGAKADTVLLIGLSDSGKTQMFSKLINNKSTVITYTSLSENVYEGLLTPSNEELRLIDFPGAERMRKLLSEKWLSKERGSLKQIVAVIDSSSINKRARDVAELLYDTLLESNKKVPMLVACNKQDVGLAKAPHKEFSLINQSRAASLQSTDGSNARASTLTNPEVAFEWSKLPVKVDFVKCCALETDVDDEEKNLTGIREAIGI
uniref:Signal recognition particle receptor subunit beta n=1 Tax=Pristionchus pacificus TaxID=54126 RepID=A0A2A6CG70_PRIPA|eukprot:PDM77212.1 ADP ribosylation factor [Pristionchus pacificus]